jgi:hypothetical protein
VLIVSALAELGTVADGGGVANPEQVGEPERVVAGSLSNPATAGMMSAADDLAAWLAGSSYRLLPFRRS